MVALYQIDKSNVSRHLRAIFAEGELDEKAVVAYVATTGLDSKTYQVRHYHLDAVIAVDYRVRSTRGTQFRQWATERLPEYPVKGFTMDDERLKNPTGPGVPDHFDELLERIRDIRASERRVYLRVREIFALAADRREPRMRLPDTRRRRGRTMHPAPHRKRGAEHVHERWSRI